MAAGYWGRAFSSGSIVPDGVVAEAIQPHLGFIGRSLVLEGEAVFEIQCRQRPVVYSLLDSPRSRAARIPSRGFMNSQCPALRRPSPEPCRRTAFYISRYAAEARHPWRGISPIKAAGTTRKLLENLEVRLAQETGAAVGSYDSGPIRSGIRWTSNRHSGNEGSSHLGRHRRHGLGRRRHRRSYE